MNRIQLELWLWLGPELGGEFEALSDMRSLLDTRVMPGTTIIELFHRVADDYPAFGEKVFDTRMNELRWSVVMIYNGLAVEPQDGYDHVLGDGDRIKIVPVHAGG
jgi:molybdopterin converting factor small subunit